MRVYDSKIAGAIAFICVALSGCGSNLWLPIETSSQRGLNVPAQLRGASTLCGLNFSWCTFDLNYFYGTDWVEWSDARSNKLPGTQEVVVSAREKPKYILFIPGGPGDIVDRYNPPRADWRVNRVYFDVRGTGLSMIPDSNAYDKFLRAEYVADDIETLRQQIFKKAENECGDGESPLENECRLGRTPWDAIYAHSWGTVVAQIYAWKYPKSVDKLILSSPVSRSVTDTSAARRAMIVDNLMKIYEAYTTVDCAWPSDEDMIKPMGGAPGGGNDKLQLTDNFCYLRKDQKDLIKNRLRSLLYQIEREYGSTTVVSRAYGEILKSQEGKFRKQYRYPLEFFRALRQLEWLGSGEDEGSRFDPFVKEQQIDAALFVGYYLLLRNKPILPATASEPPPRCVRDAPFLETIPSRNAADLLRKSFCRRIDAAREELTYNVKDSSFRAWTVFGIYDGIARWISELLEREGRTDNDGCFKDSDLRQVANGTLLPDRPFFQTMLRKIGSSSEDKICPWSPARYRHKKETLILSGDADPVTAGKQAMDFYENGLTPGKRAIIIFPRTGHEMQPQLRFESDDRDEKGPSEDTIRGRISGKFLELLESFMDLTVGQFIEDQDVKVAVEMFGAKMLPCKAELPQKKIPC